MTVVVALASAVVVEVVAVESLQWAMGVQLFAAGESCLVPVRTNSFVVVGAVTATVNSSHYLH